MKQTAYTKTRGAEIDPAQIKGCPVLADQLWLLRQSGLFG